VAAPVSVVEKVAKPIKKKSSEKKSEPKSKPPVIVASPIPASEAERPKRGWETTTTGVVAAKEVVEDIVNVVVEGEENPVVSSNWGEKKSFADIIKVNSDTKPQGLFGSKNKDSNVEGNWRKNDLTQSKPAAR